MLIRLVLTGLLLTSLPATAAEPNAGEIVLQIDSMGTAITPADRIAVQIPIIASEPTAAAARAANKATIDRLTAALVANGVSRSAIMLAGDGGAPMFGFVGNAAFDPADNPERVAMAGMSKARKTA